MDTDIDDLSSIDLYSRTIETVAQMLQKSLDSSKHVPPTVRAQLQDAANSSNTVVASIQRLQSRIEQKTVSQTDLQKLRTEIEEKNSELISEKQKNKLLTDETKKASKAKSFAQNELGTSMGVARAENQSAIQKAFAQLDTVKKQMADMKQSYETKIATLESKTESKTVSASLKREIAHLKSKHGAELGALKAQKLLQHEQHMAAQQQRDVEHRKLVTEYRIRIGRATVDTIREQAEKEYIMVCSDLVASQLKPLASLNETIRTGQNRLRSDFESVSRELEQAKNEIVSVRRNFEAFRQELQTSEQQIEDLRRLRDAALHQESLTATERDTARRERDTARGERDIAYKERETARGERQNSHRERDFARRECDIAYKERETARRERDVAREDRDIAYRDRDTARRQRNDRMADLELAKESCDRFRSDRVIIDAKTKRLEQSIVRLKQHHEDELGQADALYEEQMADQEVDFHEMFAEQQESFDQKVKGLESRFQDLLAMKDDEHSAAMANLRSELEGRIIRRQTPPLSNVSIAQCHTRVDTPRSEGRPERASDHLSEVEHIVAPQDRPSPTSRSRTQAGTQVDNVPSIEEGNEHESRSPFRAEGLFSSPRLPLSLSPRRNSSARASVLSNSDRARTPGMLSATGSKRSAEHQTDSDTEKIPPHNKRLRHGNSVASEGTPSVAAPSPSTGQANKSATRAKISGEEIQRRVNEILALVHLDWEKTDAEEIKLAEQLTSLLSRGRIVASVKEAIDKHVVGNFRKTPAYPRPCLFAALIGEGAGPGGTMRRINCPYCRNRDTLCLWAEYPEGVASGFGPRHPATGVVTDTKWRSDPAPYTINRDGREVRWLLKKREP